MRTYRKTDLRSKNRFSYCGEQRNSSDNYSPLNIKKSYRLDKYLSPNKYRFYKSRSFYYQPKKLKQWNLKREHNWLGERF